ncbi:hypothetical protein [Salisediminibacterium halotolerans]|uniref:hypothetical protein n=1 Tax=Salisediminibacterium halotolerans TaxID=517425 RepID=UPI000EAF46FC|nr:hypothetical protein [Salisediminibacterium halotolerans]RLJ81016.1 hypothetical protein BCL39_0077 [Actinophytocola xinjiangensis]RPE87894.1 hypothetical protein EDD67_1634 [Salisediminibacterium halotolerans]TWG37909.1 hypothetical protein BCL52_0077 [Salisediminibacterium halotolerans]GEL08340.1 hypothetical protein SHA02_17560 [Salisediminibacterium halotolerans]
MQTTTDLLTKFKQFPSLLGEDLTYIRSQSFFADNLTTLDYEDQQKNNWRVYFFEKPLTRVYLGVLFDYVAAELDDEAILHRVVCSPEFADNYRALLEQFEFSCFNIYELASVQPMLSQAAQDRSSGRTYEDELIMFGEDLLHQDLNTAWSDFTLLFSDRVVKKELSATEAEQQRHFHVYFRGELYDEGQLRIVYKQGERKLKCPHTVHLELIGIENRAETLFLTTLPLMEALDRREGQLFVNIPYDEKRIETNDRERIEWILKKWELDTFDMMSLQDYSINEMRTFIQKMAAVTLLQGAAVKS